MLKIMSKAKYSALVEDKEKWQSEAGDLATKNERYVKQLQNSSTKLLECRQTEQSKNIEIYDLEVLIKQKGEVIGKLTEEIEKLGSRKSEIYRDLKKAEESLEESETNLSNSRSLLHKSRTELTKLKSENKSLTIRNEGLNDALKDVSNGHSKLLRENQALIQKNAKLQKFEDEVGSVLIEAVSLIKSGGLKLPHNVNKALKLLQKHTAPVVVEKPIKDEVSGVVGSVVVKKSAQPGPSTTCRAYATLAESNNEIDSDVKTAYKKKTPIQEKK